MVSPEKQIELLLYRCIEQGRTTKFYNRVTCVDGISYTCTNRRLTENVFKRISANSNPNLNPTLTLTLKRKNLFGKAKRCHFSGKCSDTVLL